MSRVRRLWTNKEDKILKDLRSKGIQKWSEIAKIMENQYKIIGRTGKQCRQRWFNNLDPKVDTKDWSQEDNSKLFKLHDQFGNSWIKFSKQFKGRTDNSIKNHFYAVLRKSIRRINKFVTHQQQQQMKQLNVGIVSKIVSAAQARFDKKMYLPKYLIDKAHQLKNKLVPLQNFDMQSDENKQQIIELLKQIQSFQTEYDKTMSLQIQQRKERQLKTSAQYQSIKISINSMSSSKPNQYSTTTFHQNLFKRTSQSREQVLELSRVSSNSIFRNRSICSQSQSGSGQLRMLNKNSSSGLVLAAIQDSQKQGEIFIYLAVLSSSNNMFGFFGEIPEAALFMDCEFQRLDLKFKKIDKK